jgi:hypothetical protein
LPGRKCSVSDVAGGAGIGTGQLARTLRARYRPQAASARLPEEAAVASNAMLATARLDHIVHHLALALGGRSAASFARRLMLPVSNDTRTPRAQTLHSGLRGLDRALSE